MVSVFIAVPQITRPDVIEAMRQQAKEAGFTAVFAVDVKKQSDNDHDYFNAVLEAMAKADVLIANLTPFLGVEPDPDVIFQLGFMAALRKPVFSFSNVSKSFFARVLEWNGHEFSTEIHLGESGIPTTLKRDRDNMRIENMGIPLDCENDLEDPGADNLNNLMLEGPSTKTRTKVLTPKVLHLPEIEEDKLYSDLSVFEQAIRTVQLRSGCDKAIEVAPLQVRDENPDAIYLAGPGVFLPNLVEYFNDLKAVIKSCAVHLVGIAPIDAQMDFGAMQRNALANGNNPFMRETIYDADSGVMESVRRAICNFTPHHGVAGDSGTIFEAGYMTGKDYRKNRGPQVFGFSSCSKSLYERIIAWLANPEGPSYGGREAAAFYANDKTTVYSPMLDAAILASGGSLDHRLSKEREEERSLSEHRKYTSLAEFDSCVKSMVPGLATSMGMLSSSAHTLWGKPKSAGRQSPVVDNNEHTRVGIATAFS